MPPLVLAVTQKNVIDADKIDADKLLEYIKGNTDDVLILDGLQRTYTLIDARNEIEKEDKRKMNQFFGYSLRLEVYVEINRFGVLYRMLTLNTGQTPMSPRHQLEMLYSDMLDTEIEGVTLIPDNEGSANPDDCQFIFKNAIEGFNSYMNRNELPIDRQELLDNIKMMENMSEEDISGDLFKEFLEGYIKVFNVLRAITGEYNLTKDDAIDYEISNSPYGRKVSKVFSTSQALTGYGSAIGKMKDNAVITDIKDITPMLQKLKKGTMDMSGF